MITDFMLILAHSISLVLTAQQGKQCARDHWRAIGCMMGKPLVRFQLYYLFSGQATSPCAPSGLAVLAYLFAR